MKQKEPGIRLNSYLSRAGTAARRKCDRLIKNGKINVDGRVVTNPGFLVDAGRNSVELEGRKITLPEKFEYVLLNKPKGVVSTACDERGRKTVLDLVPDMHRLFPVGRLDIATTGLLLLTNDGNLGYRLAHPRYAIDKVYRVALNKPLTENHETKLQRGVTIGRKETIPVAVRILSRKRDSIEVTTHEGRKNMIRRIFKTLGYTVESLDRTRYAFLTKRKLPRSGWRLLSPSEVKKLYSCVKLERNE